MEWGEGFSRIPNPWLEAMAKAGCSASEVLAVAALCGRMRPDRGGAWVAGYPAAELCERLGWTEAKRYQTVRRLRARGFLEPVGCARKGRSADYRLFPGIPYRFPDRGREGPAHGPTVRTPKPRRLPGGGDRGP